MDNQFWHNKWQKQELGFHLDTAHPLLKKYYQSIFPSTQNNPINESVFVPLCGKTLDMRYFLSKGQSVLGCELSEIAAREFFVEEENNGQLTISKKNNFSIYSAPINQCESKILVSDYFDLSVEDTRSCNSIYDRAALVALPNDLRAKYVKHLRFLLPCAKMLLITLDYDQQQMSGPPFSVEQNEVEELFSFAKIKRLKRSNIIEDEPHFKSKGLTHFYQTAYQIEWD